MYNVIEIKYFREFFLKSDWLRYRLLSPSFEWRAISQPQPLLATIKS